MPDFNIFDRIHDFIAGFSGNDDYDVTFIVRDGDKVMETHDANEFQKFLEELENADDESEESDGETMDCDGDCDNCDSADACDMAGDELLSEDEEYEPVTLIQIPVAGVFAAAALVASVAGLIAAIKKK